MECFKIKTSLIHNTQNLNKNMRPKLWVFGLLICVIHVKLSEQVILETAAVAEAAEIIGVVRIGVSLVEYIYKGKNLKFNSI